MGPLARACANMYGQSMAYGRSSWQARASRSCRGEVRVNEARVRAYRVLLAQGMLHLKWDLSGFYGGLSLFLPWKLLRQSRLIRIAACRAFAFHNLAIFAANDFVDFSEENSGRISRRFAVTSQKHSAHTATYSSNAYEASRYRYWHRTGRAGAIEPMILRAAAKPHRPFSSAHRIRTKRTRVRKALWLPPAPRSAPNGLSYTTEPAPPACCLRDRAP